MRMVQYAYRGGMVLETLQFLNERRPLEVEELGGLALVAPGPSERQVDQIAFDLRDERVEVEAFLWQRDGCWHDGLLSLLNFRRKIDDVDLRSTRPERDGTLDRVFELTHVAG